MIYRIALLGEGNCFESIISKLSDTEITILSYDSNSEVFNFAKERQIKCKYVPKEESSSFFATNSFDLIVLENYAEEVPEEILTLGKFINIHPALLPSFKGKDALQRAFLAGVKVSGVTVHWVTADVDGGKIIAQYPVLIGNSTHFDEFRNEIIKTERMLYPIVIEKLLKDEVFDFSDLLGSCSNSGCQGCGTCNH